MEIGPAETTDFEQLWPLVRDFPIGGEPTLAIAEWSLGSILTDPKAALLVCRTGGVIVGYVLLFEQPMLFADGPAAYVQELMVDEAHRGSGVGGELMAAAERWARDRGCRSVRLATSKAAAFYGSRGYQEVASFLRKPL